MKMMEFVLLACASAVVVASARRADEPLSDDAMKERIVQFVTLPSRMCGRALAVFREEFPNHKLTNRAWFDGDTNRLARLIAELAQTNDVELSSQMVETLGEYGTVEQLPFLYSCATNPAIGDLAVKAVLRIEGVTSNSIAIAQSYLLSSNEFSRAKQHDRSLVCEELLKSAFELPELSEYRPLCLSVAREFARNVNTMHISIDDAIVANDPSYRYSKRRLAVMRSAQYRCVNPGLYTYVTNAINELVAYPESDLPD